MSLIPHHFPLTHLTASYVSFRHGTWAIGHAPYGSKEFSIQPTVASMCRSQKGGGLALRGDARWMGFARATDCDLFVGLTALETALLAQVTFD